MKTKLVTALVCMLTIGSSLTSKADNDLIAEFQNTNSSFYSIPQIASSQGDKILYKIKSSGDDCPTRDFDIYSSDFKPIDKFSIPLNVYEDRTYYIGPKLSIEYSYEQYGYENSGPNDNNYILNLLLKYIGERKYKTYTVQTTKESELTYFFYENESLPEYNNNESAAHYINRALNTHLIDTYLTLEVHINVEAGTSYAYAKEYQRIAKAVADKEATEIYYNQDASGYHYDDNMYYTATVRIKDYDSGYEFANSYLYLSQTIFNDTPDYEYVRILYGEPITTSYNTTTYISYTDSITGCGASSKEEVECFRVCGKAIGYEVVNAETGASVCSFTIPSKYANISAQYDMPTVIILGGKKYFSFSCFDSENNMYDLVYELSSPKMSGEQKPILETKVSVSPTLVRRGETINVNAAMDNEIEDVTVTSINGIERRIKVNPDRRSANVDSSNLTPGMHLVGVKSSNSAQPTITKVLVK